MLLYPLPFRLLHVSAQHANPVEFRLVGIRLAPHQRHDAVPTRILRSQDRISEFDIVRWSPSSRRNMDDMRRDSQLGLVLSPWRVAFSGPFCAEHAAVLGFEAPYSSYQRKEPPPVCCLDSFHTHRLGLVSMDRRESMGWG